MNELPPGMKKKPMVEACSPGSLARGVARRKRTDRLLAYKAVNQGRQREALASVLVAPPPILPVARTPASFEVQKPPHLRTKREDD